LAYRPALFRTRGDPSRPKRTLGEAIASKGLKLSPGGQDAIDRQDARIYRWHAIDAVPEPFAALPGELAGEAAASEGLALGGRPW